MVLGTLRIVEGKEEFNGVQVDRLVVGHLTDPIAISLKLG